MVPNGVQGRWKYDSNDRPTELIYTDAAKKTISGWTYTYDAAGRRTRRRVVAHIVRIEQVVDSGEVRLVPNLLEDPAHDRFVLLGGHQQTHPPSPPNPGAGKHRPKGRPEPVKRVRGRST